MESRARRLVSGIPVIACAALVAAGVTLARASGESPILTGTFALLGGTAKIVSTLFPKMKTALAGTLNVTQYQLDGKTVIFNYDDEMQRTIHLIVIRDDFATFAHLHPAFDTTTGAFVQEFTKQPNHRYFVYADTAPHGIGQQVFRFTLASAGEAAAVKVSSAPSAPSASAGPYTVVLEKTTLAANTPQSLDLTVNENGQPAQDLGTYLGAPAHCVFVNTSSLAYVHIHPMVRNDTHVKGPIHMNMTGAGPLMEMHLPALPAGTYKLWIQFRGGSYKLYTVPFTIAVQ